MQQLFKVYLFCTQVKVVIRNRSIIQGYSRYSTRKIVTKVFTFNKLLILGWI